MSENKIGVMIPPPANEQATKPIPKPSPDDKAKIDKAVALQELQMLGEAAEARQAEEEVAPELALAEEDLRVLHIPAIPQFEALDVTSTAAPKAGIEDVDAYRKWLADKIKGNSSSNPPEEI
jgi:hypothetical protein